MTSGLLAYFGHHKCATIWISSIVSSVCKKIGLHFVEVHGPPLFNHNLKTFVEKEKIDFLSYTNANIKFVARLDNFTGFHVIRDPRDMIVSAYFSHLHSHPTDIWPELISHRQKLAKLSKEEGLFLEMEFSKNVMNHLYTWDYNRENVLEIKLEDLSVNPYEEFEKIFDFLNLLGESTVFKRKRKISVKKLHAIVYRNRFSAKAKGRKKGMEDAKHHYRKGVAGDWVNHFNKEHREYFEKEYGDLLIKLGYE